MTTSIADVLGLQPTIAGAAAVLVAFSPTGAPDGFPRPSWWTGRTGTIHNVSAAVLFGAFISFALFLFPKSKVKKGNPLPLDKRVRNGFYTAGVIRDSWSRKHGVPFAVSGPGLPCQISLSARILARRERVAGSAQAGPIGLR